MKNRIPECERGEIQNRVDDRPGAVCGSPYTIGKCRIGYQHSAMGDGSPCFMVVKIWPDGAISGPDDGKAFAYTISAVKAWIDKTYKRKRSLKLLDAEEFRGPLPLIITGDK